jgi:DNA-binding transcriptional MerR regulator
VSADLTIEQLAAESGMTVRNIRAHQARGLIAPPEVRMRVGYYGPEHVAALQLIRELQQDGFNRAAIKRLLSDRERTEERLRRFRASLLAPTGAEPPQALTASDVYEFAQEQVDPVAAAFIARFVADVWREFEQAGMPIERRPQVDDAIERLRPLAQVAVADAFAQRLDARIEDAFVRTADVEEPRLEGRISSQSSGREGCRFAHPSA